MAINDDCTLCAVVDGGTRRVLIHAMDASGGRRTDVPTVEVRGAPTTTTTRFDPKQLCFAKRGSVETLLVTSGGNGGLCGITEVSAAAGGFMRFIGLEGASMMRGIAYTPQKDVIAVTFLATDPCQHGVRILQYESGNVIRTIGSTWNVGSTTFSTNGVCLYVSYLFGRPHNQVCYVQMFPTHENGSRTLSIRGTPVHGGTPDNITLPICGVMLCADDGGVIVVCKRDMHDTALVYMDASVTTVLHRVVVPGEVAALAWLGTTLCCKNYDGDMYAVIDEWSESLRAAWVTACVGYS